MVWPAGGCENSYASRLPTPAVMLRGITSMRRQSKIYLQKSPPRQRNANEDRCLTWIDEHRARPTGPLERDASPRYLWTAEGDLLGWKKHHLIFLRLRARWQVTADPDQSMLRRGRTLPIKMWDLALNE